MRMVIGRLRADTLKLFDRHKNFLRYHLLFSGSLTAPWLPRVTRGIYSRLLMPGKNEPSDFQQQPQPQAPRRRFHARLRRAMLARWIGLKIQPWRRSLSLVASFSCRSTRQSPSRPRIWPHQSLPCRLFPNQPIGKFRIVITTLGSATIIG